MSGYRWTVLPREGGRLSSFLLNQFPGASGKSLKKALEANGCRVNGRVERFASRELKTGDVVEFRWPGQVEREASILHEDPAFLVIHKPAGWSCDQTLLQRLMPTWGQLWLVHRLDRDTTGALILARQPETRAAFEKLFEAGAVKKTYWAVVDGIPGSVEGVQDQPLIRKEVVGSQQRWAAAAPGEGLPAETRWRVLAAGRDCALLECQPITGRTHQIRVHLALMGHPILGDRQYAARFRCGYLPERFLLHAQALEFPHPNSGERVAVQATLPSELQRALDHLGLSPEHSKSR